MLLSDFILRTQPEARRGGRRSRGEVFNSLKKEGLPVTLLIDGKGAA